MEDDIGTRYRTASVRIGTTVSAFLLTGLLLWLVLTGSLDEFPLWLTGVVLLWILYASAASVRYYRRGYTTYERSE